MRAINLIIVHCSATPPNMNIGANEIRKWHMDKGDRDIGYHYVIRRNGEIEHGRDEAVAGAHCKGHNANSIGICLVGGVDRNMKPENNFTEAQFETLERWLRALKADYVKAAVHGHNEFSTKACPSFDVQAWCKARKV